MTRGHSSVGSGSPGEPEARGVKSGLDSRRVLADSSLVVLASLAGGAFLFFANLYLARSFGPEAFGRFRVVIAFFSFVVIFFECGTGPSLVRYISQLGAEGARDLVRKVLLFRAGVFAALAGSVFLLREILASRVLRDTELAPFMVAGAVFVACFYFEITKFIVVAYQRIVLYAGSIAATLFLNGALAVGLALFGGVAGAIVGWGLGYVLGNAASMLYIVRSGGLRRGPKVGLKKVLLTYGLPMQVEQVVRGLELAVVPLWSLVFGEVEIGILAFAMVFYRPVMLVASAFNSVLMPRFARMGTDGDWARRSRRQALMLMTPIVVLGSLAAVLLAETVIQWVDPAYLRAAPIFRILVVYGLASGYGAILVSYYAGLGRVKRAIAVTAIQQVGLLVVSYLGLLALA